MDYCAVLPSALDPSVEQKATALQHVKEVLADLLCPLHSDTVAPCVFFDGVPIGRVLHVQDALRLCRTVSKI